MTGINLASKKGENIYIFKKVTLQWIKTPECPRTPTLAGLLAKKGSLSQFDNLDKVRRKGKGHGLLLLSVLLLMMMIFLEGRIR